MKMHFDYPKKTRFKCLKCSICCGDTQTKTRNILLTEQEAATIAAKTNQPVSAFAQETKENSLYRYEMRKTREQQKCIFLNKCRCTIYTIRPLICRFYPFGLKTNEHNRKLFYYTAECPGINKGNTMTKTDFDALIGKATRQLNPKQKRKPLDLERKIQKTKTRKGRHQQ